MNNQLKREMKRDLEYAIQLGKALKSINDAAFDAIAREKNEMDQEEILCPYIAKCPDCEIMTKVIYKDLHEPGRYPGSQWEYGVAVYACCEGRVEE